MQQFLILLRRHAGRGRDAFPACPSGRSRSWRLALMETTAGTRPSGGASPQSSTVFSRPPSPPSLATYILFPTTHPGPVLPSKSDYADLRDTVRLARPPSQGEVPLAPARPPPFPRVGSFPAHSLKFCLTSPPPPLEKEKRSDSSQFFFLSCLVVANLVIQNKGKQNRTKGAIPVTAFPAYVRVHITFQLSVSVPQYLTLP